VISRYLRHGDCHGYIVEDAFRVLVHKWNLGDTLAVDATSVAAVILFMSLVLCPGPSHEYVFQLYWSVLLRTDDIRKYNWSHYILEEVAHGARQVKECIGDEEVHHGNNGLHASFASMYLATQFLCFPYLIENVFIEIIDLHIADFTKRK